MSEFWTYPKVSSVWVKGSRTGVSSHAAISTLGLFWHQRSTLLYSMPFGKPVHRGFRNTRALQLTRPARARDGRARRRVCQGNPPCFRFVYHLKRAPAMCLMRSCMPPRGHLRAPCPPRATPPPPRYVRPILPCAPHTPHPPPPTPHPPPAYRPAGCPAPS
jgi:hypothetical protein